MLLILSLTKHVDARTAGWQLPHAAILDY